MWWWWLLGASRLLVCTCCRRGQGCRWPCTTACVPRVRVCWLAISANMQIQSLELCMTYGRCFAFAAVEWTRIARAGGLLLHTAPTSRDCTASRVIREGRPARKLSSAAVGYQW
jgi:hypothetical protein